MTNDEIQSCPSGQVRCCNNKLCRTMVYPAASALDDGTVSVTFLRESNNEPVSPVLRSVTEALAWFTERQRYWVRDEVGTFSTTDRNAVP